jgi:hypothetical protein
MPGLLGSVVLSQKPSEKQLMISRSLFNHMCGVEQRTGPVAQAAIPERGIHLGRSGMADLHTSAWPTITSDGRRAFIAGRPGPARGDRPIGDAYVAAFVDDRGPVVVEMDRTANFPLYWIQIGSTLCFASDQRALLALDGVGRKVDLGSLGVFFPSGIVGGGRTFFNDIRRLECGQRLILDEDKVVVEEYWRFSPGLRRQDQSSDAERARRFAALIQSAVRRNVKDASTTAFYLSGGLDSRTMLAAYVNEAGVDPRDLRAVTWGDLDRGSCGDFACAERVALTLGVRHKKILRPFSTYENEIERSFDIVGGGHQVVADQPNELGVMALLRDMGFRHGVRGDQLLVPLNPVFSVHQAMHRVNFRRLSEMENVRPLFRRALLPEIEDCADEALGRIAERYRSYSPEDLLEVLYLEQRLPNYLLPSTSWRRNFLNDCNPLLDDAILDFIETVPTHLRKDRRIFVDAARIIWGDRPPAPLATTQELFCTDERVRRRDSILVFLQRQIDDRESAVWDYLDHGAIKTLVAEKLESRESEMTRRRILLRKMRQQLKLLSPRLAMTLTLKVKKRLVSPQNLINSFIVFKRVIDERDGRIATPAPGVDGRRAAMTLHEPA